MSKEYGFADVHELPYVRIDEAKAVLEAVATDLRMVNIGTGKELEAVAVVSDILEQALDQYPDQRPGEASEDEEV